MPISFKAVEHINYIYGLADPLSGNIRYVGKSYDPNSRYRMHLKIKEPKTHKEFWIVSLKKLGLLPELVILETTTELQAAEREIFWIAEYRSLGFKLTNSTDGGEGVRGRKHSEEAKVLLSKRMLGNKFSLGFHHSQETRLKMTQNRVGMTGKNHSEETKSKISQGKTGSKHSEETKAKMRLAHKIRISLMTKEQRSDITARGWATRKKVS